MYLCIYVSMYLCIYVSMYLCIYVSRFLGIYVSNLCIYESRNLGNRGESDVFNLFKGGGHLIFRLTVSLKDRMFQQVLM